MTELHTHRLAECHECDHDGPCIHCDGRGYYEVCMICGEPMGNKRRAWKRDQQPESSAPQLPPE